MQAPGSLPALIEEYRAGLEAELVILRGLQRVSQQQHAATDAHDIDALGAAAEERDRLMNALVNIEGPLRDIRKTLSELRDKARLIPGYQDMLVVHHEAVTLVSEILKTDDASVQALARAERLRRDNVRAVEQGETTLAAYRRVMTSPTGATLVDKRG
jgi:predicted RNase H-like nuclease (RuvC/YqgF family)